MIFTIAFLIGVYDFVDDALRDILRHAYWDVRDLIPLTFYFSAVAIFINWVFEVGLIRFKKEINTKKPIEKHIEN